MNFLVEDLLEIKASDHSKIQAWTKRYLLLLPHRKRSLAKPQRPD